VELYICFFICFHGMHIDNLVYGFYIVILQFASDWAILVYFCLLQVFRVSFFILLP